jgi:hypothetical protein
MKSIFDLCEMSILIYKKISYKKEMGFFLTIYRKFYVKLGFTGAESSHACTPSVIACMYTHSHTHTETHTHTHTHTHTPRHTHTHSTHTHTHTETHTHTHTHTHTPRHTHTQTHRHTRTFVCTHAVARQCRRVPVIPSTVSCCISTNLLIDTHDIDKLRLRI